MSKDNFIRRIVESGGGLFKKRHNHKKENDDYIKVRRILVSVENRNQLGVAIKVVNNFINKYGIKNNSDEYIYLKRLIGAYKIKFGVKKPRKDIKGDDDENISERMNLRDIIREEVNDFSWINDIDRSWNMDKKYVVDFSTIDGNYGFTHQDKADIVNKVFNTGVEMGYINDVNGWSPRTNLCYIYFEPFDKNELCCHLMSWNLCSEVVENEYQVISPDDFFEMSNQTISEDDELLDEDSMWDEDESWGTDKSMWDNDPYWGSKGGDYGGGDSGGDSGGDDF